METERDDPLRGPLMWNRQEDDGEDFRKWNMFAVSLRAREEDRISFMSAGGETRLA